MLAPVRTMPSVTRSQHTWLVRLSTLTAFVLALGWVSNAAATTAVPMCGRYAQTIAAPPIGTPASSDAISAGEPCQVRDLLRAVGVPQRDVPEKYASALELPTRALPVLPRLPDCPESSRVSPAARAHELPATGFARSIDRPPRS